MIAGDTDTNAGIAGGLVGAIIGFQELPIAYLEKIFKVQYTVKNTYTSMPREYEPSNFLRNVLTLINKSKAHLQRQQANPIESQA